MAAGVFGVILMVLSDLIGECVVSAEYCYYSYYYSYYDCDGYYNAGAAIGGAVAGVFIFVVIVVIIVVLVKNANRRQTMVTTFSRPAAGQTVITTNQQQMGHPQPQMYNQYPPPAGHPAYPPPRY